jgi:hypothetical protein
MNSGFLGSAVVILFFNVFWFIKFRKHYIDAILFRSNDFMSVVVWLYFLCGVFLVFISWSK